MADHEYEQWEPPEQERSRAEEEPDEKPRVDKERHPGGLYEFTGEAAKYRKATIWSFSAFWVVLVGSWVGFLVGWSFSLDTLSVVAVTIALAAIFFFQARVRRAVGWKWSLERAKGEAGTNQQLKK